MELKEQSMIVKQRLQYHFGSPSTGDWNILEGMPFMKEFLNEVEKLTELCDENKHCQNDKVILKAFKQRFWEVAEVYKNDKKIADINKFYEVNDQWILIYDTVGGQGTGFRKGGLIKKIFIGDCEFENIIC